MPHHMMKPSALELIKRGRKDFADVERYSADPKAFLDLLDSLGVERAGLINYVAPTITKQFCCRHPPMAGDDRIVMIDQNRIGKTEGADARSNLVNLMLGMLSCITGVGLLDVESLTSNRIHFIRHSIDPHAVR